MTPNRTDSCQPSKTQIDLSAITNAIGPIFAELEPQDRPILIAFVERSVGNLYREWSANTSDLDIRRQLLQLAEREDENAFVLETHDPMAGERLLRLKANHPQLETLLATTVAGLSLTDQMRVLAEAERAGGALYQAFAAAETDPTYRSALLECDSREQQNADALATLAASIDKEPNGMTNSRPGLQDIEKISLVLSALFILLTFACTSSPAFLKGDDLLEALRGQTESGRWTFEGYDIQFSQFYDPDGSVYGHSIRDGIAETYTGRYEVREGGCFHFQFDTRVTLANGCTYYERLGKTRYRVVDPNGVALDVTVREGRHLGEE